MSTPFRTADLCDRYAHVEYFQIAEPVFRCYGSRSAFGGPITTLKVFEDDAPLKQALAQTVDGRVLVVDGGASHRCALLDEDSARLALDNGWQGVIIYGCIRDSASIDRLNLGVRALHAHPLKSHKPGHGSKDVLITFAGVNFRTGHYVYADEDGIIVSADKLS
ncbi:MAG: RraA family protein [Methylococcaceae bacterium]|nr:MAG: RraA family protein [Methylococcaceae bacterium]